MSIYSKLGGAGLNILSGGANKIIKAGGSILKTTSKIGTGGAEALAGGKPVQKSVVRFMDTSAKVAGKTVKTAGIVGLGAGALTLGGAKVYDYVKDVTSETEAQRQAGIDLRQASDYQDLMERELNLMDRLKGLRGSSDSMALGGGLSDYIPIVMPSDSAVAKQKESGGLGILGTALLIGGAGIGGFYLLKKLKKKK